MSRATNVPERAEAVRQKTLATLKTLKEKGKAFALPEPPPGLEMYQGKLEENTYQVLVVGEAKRGKSTFVNALIGRELLPTDVDIATSQVFRICPAQREAYRLHFEDDSQQVIAAADLARYGSQVVADQDGVPRLDQIIRWIEVDVPVRLRFWPPNVRILDTPGLGGLYVAHAQITHRFVPHADAVIFVLESQAPIGEPEAQFVEKLLDVTRNLFFIQTKIDQFRREAWQEIQKRNQDILQHRFKDRLLDTRVWPISSTNLGKAAETGDDDYLMVSRHKELAAALQAFLFRVAGWSRSAEAILVAGHYHSQSRKILAGRLDGLMEESQQKRTESHQHAMQCRGQFEADWQDRGQKRRDLVEDLQKVSMLGKQRMRQVLQPGGDIEIAYHAEIEKLDSLAAISRYCQALAGEVVDSVLAHWRQVQEKAQTQCCERLVPFLSAADTLATLPPTGSSTPTLPSGSTLAFSEDQAARFLNKFRVSLGLGSTATTAVGLGYYALFTAGLMSAPVAPAILGVALVWGMFQGWRSASQSELKTARQELARLLANHLRQVHKHFFDVDQASGRFSLVDEYFNSLEQSLTHRVAQIATNKLTEAQAEINRQAEEARLDDLERKEKATIIQGQLAGWDGIGHSIQALQAELTTLDSK